MGMKKKFDHETFIRSLTTRPGVYCMHDTAGAMLYVGKAKNLKKRVASYFSGRQGMHPRTRSLVQAIAHIEITVTHTETEALILENNLIKKYRPRYNIWFRDDKSYPYIHISMDHRYPGFSYYRGARNARGRYFGPYPSANAARQSLHLLQKLFQIRSCRDSFFANRTRPCLQYQIRRCSAPCVNLISAADYRHDVQHAVMFLEGKSKEVIELLLEPMHQAAAALEYERAAHYRNQISYLRKVQEQQAISTQSGDADVIACAVRENQCCVQVMFIRAGLNQGSKSYFPALPRDSSAADVVGAFLPQYYLDREGGKPIPDEIILSHAPTGLTVLEKTLSTYAGQTVAVKTKVRSDRAKWLKMARDNAEIALTQRLSGKDNYRALLDAVQIALDLPGPLERIECFDVSHTQGGATVASCVVFGMDGALTSSYRRYNIEGITPGDDYAAMQQVLQRRYLRLKKEEGSLPDLILVDGGRGQVSAAAAVLEELQLSGITLMGVAKGPARKPGQETLMVESEHKAMRLAPDSPALHLIQRIRDEAHRFAITGHRHRRAKASQGSLLEQIEGIGSKRRQNLIRYFGGIQGIASAGVDDLATVPGINKNLAEKIYDLFHG